MFRSPEYLINASKANLQASMSLAARSIEDAAELVRRQLKVAMAMAGNGSGTLKSVSGDAAAPVRSRAEHNECRDRQLQNILDLSCQCLEVTAAAQTELVRLIQDTFQNLNEAMKINPDGPAGEHGTPRALKRA